MAKGKAAPAAAGRATATSGAKRSGPHEARGPQVRTTAATEPEPGAGSDAKRARARRVDADTRRQAILDAALSVFAEHGFEAAKLDDVARRAGVAKGTLYLHFAHKEALFEELVRSAVTPLIEQVSAVAADPSVPPLAVLDAFFAAFQAHVLGTRRKLLVRLIMAEGPRFPAIAEFYYREVVSRGLHLVRTVAARAAANGDLTSDAAARFPQLIVAPLLMSVIWDGMFAKIDPLDVNGLLAAHREVLTGKPAAAEAKSNSPKPRRTAR